MIGATTMFAVSSGSLQALALDPTRALTQYRHDAWRAEQGLPQNTVQAILQTRDGYLWLGTQEGLVRFDGARFTVFDKDNTPQFKQNIVLALDEDRDGNLWVGLRGGGLLRFRDGHFTSFTTADGLTSDRVRAIHADREGSVWVGITRGGLNRFRNGSFTPMTTRDGLSHDEVVSILEDHEGTLWVGTFGGGLNRIRDGHVTIYSKKNGLSGDQVSSIVEGRDGSLWVGTFDGGVNQLREGRITALTTRQGLASDEVWSLLEDRDGNLWVGTTGGLNRVRGGTVATLTKTGGLTDDVVVSLFEDREGSLWVGTFGGGLNRLRDAKFTPMSAREGLSSDNVLSIYEDRQGTIWMGTDGGGLNRLTNGTLTALRMKDGLPSDQITSFGETAGGDLWIGTRGGGLARLRGKSLSRLSRREGLASDDVASLFADREGSLWIGTSGGGLGRLRDGRVTTFATNDGLSDDYVTAILQDGADGALWIGTSNGLNRLVDGTFMVYGVKDGLSDAQITSLHQSADGSLWIGTLAGGVNRWREGGFTRFTKKDGLFDDRVFDVLEDRHGFLWMSSNKGIFRVRKADLEAFARGRSSTFESQAFGLFDGMRSPECNGDNQPAAWAARDGRLWFPTIQGVVVVDPSRIPVNAIPPPVVIEELAADGVPVGAAGGAFDVRPGTSTLTLRYTALSLAVPQRVRFRYQLEGFDKTWIDAGAERTAHYTNLAPGSYTFRVRAANDDGVWNETGTSSAIRILPLFHQTRWFQALVGLGIAFLGFVAHRVRVQRLQARANRLEAVVGERTAELRNANEDLKNAQEQLARLSQNAGAMVEDLAVWGPSMAEEVRRAIRARRVDVFRAEGEKLVPLASTPARPPAWKDVEAARGGVADGRDTLVAVTGVTNEIRGALLIEGTPNWGDTERGLVAGLAQHLGSALDFQALRTRLAVSTSRQAEVRQQMLDQGIATVNLCPRCGRCYDQTVAVCGADASELDGSRLLAYRVQDRYRLVRLLGEGGMGSVFAAQDEKLDREVALKIIRADRLGDAEARFRLDREARALASVRHPSVVGLFDSGELEDGSAFLVMELLAGSSLADLLLKHGRGTPAQVAALTSQVGSALGAAHRVGVVHRDVKPGNILVVSGDEGFQAKVLDFGLAKSTRADARLTQTGVLLGTPAYMSPEQVDAGEIDGRTDMYSLAAVAYEALTGRRLVEGDDVARTMMDVLYGGHPAVSSLVTVPDGVDDAFDAALAKRPEDRPLDIEAWSRGLAALLENASAAEGAGWSVPTR